VAAVVVGNGADAVAAVKKQSYDLVLMDMQMPVLDGVSAMRQLRQWGYVNAIVALTANQTLKDQRLCQEAGANGFLAKPIDVESFYATLRQYLHANENSANEKETVAEKSYDEEYQALVATFLSHLPEVVQEISARCDNREWPGLLASAHRLKGTGGAFGYPEISQMARTIMECAEKRSENGLQEAVDQLNLRCSELMKKAG